MKFWILTMAKTRFSTQKFPGRAINLDSAVVVQASSLLRICIGIHKDISDANSMQAGSLHHNIDSPVG